MRDVTDDLTCSQFVKGNGGHTVQKGSYRSQLSFYHWPWSVIALWSHILSSSIP